MRYPPLFRFETETIKFLERSRRPQVLILSINPPFSESMILPENFKRNLLFKMEKLSNKGWSYHKRLVKLDANSICYFRAVPKDFVGRLKNSFIL